MENPGRNHATSGRLKAISGLKSWILLAHKIGPFWNGSEPVLANQENYLVFNAAFNAEEVMERSDLNDMFTISWVQLPGFSPQYGCSKAEFEKLRTEQSPIREELEKKIVRNISRKNLNLSDVVEIGLKGSSGP